MKPFEPDYRNVVNVARNIEVPRVPLYEHNVSWEKIGEIIGKDLDSLYKGSDADLDEFFHYYCNFFKDNGYDVVTFECCIGAIMPGSGALGDSRVDPVIKDASDFRIIRGKRFRICTLRHIPDISTPWKDRCRRE